MVKAITFDLDGVYFVNGKSNFISNITKLGVLEDEVKRVFLKSDEMNNLYKTGKMNDNEFWTWAAKEWRLDKTPEELIKILIDGYEVDEKVVETVKKTRENGYMTLICTNNFPARINGLQRRFKFLDNFDEYVFSYEVGVTKPDKKIFEVLLSKSGVKADKLIYSDDDEEKLSGARELGINCFVYEGFDKFLGTLRELDVKI